MGWLSQIFGQQEKPFKAKYYDVQINDFISIDLETTGLHPYSDRIIQLSAVRYINRRETDSFNQIINPGIPIPPEASNINGITDEMVYGKPQIRDIGKSYFEFVERSPYVIGYNVKFDLGFLSAFSGYDVSSVWNWIDVLSLVREAIPGKENYKLETISNYIHYNTQFHNSLNDCRACTEIFNFLCEK